MFDTLKRSTEYQKIQGGLAAKGPAALFGLPPAGRAQLLALLAAGPLKGPAGNTSTGALQCWATLWAGG